jgi:hypothetical protein
MSQFQEMKHAGETRVYYTIHTDSPPLGYGSVFAEEHDWDWLRIGTWRYGSQIITGGGGQEKSVELDLCGMVTSYNPALTSLIDSHHGGLFRDAK